MDIIKRIFRVNTQLVLVVVTVCGVVKVLGQNQPKLNITSSTVVCATNFTPVLNNLPDGVQSVTYNWTFGDGNHSQEQYPVHVYATPGKYDVNLEVTYQNSATGQRLSLSAKKRVNSRTSNGKNIFEESVVPVTTTSKSNIISCSVTTFADTWPADVTTIGLLNKNSFLSGTQGVWRSEANYIYSSERKQSSSIDLSRDGSYSLEQFSWEHADQAIPNWMKTDSTVHYNPFGYSTERIDTFGIYTSTLYDFGGYRPSAVGVNMHQFEMAFTSFEIQDTISFGNWMFGESRWVKYANFNVQAADRNVALVSVSLNGLKDLNAVDVFARAADNVTRFNVVQQNEIICKQASADNPDWSILVFKESPFQAAWSGQIRLPIPMVKTEKPVFDNTIAHTGKSSMKISEDKVFEQHIIEIKPGVSYQISAWVSVNDLHVLTPTLSSDLGIEVNFKSSATGATLSKMTLTPAGEIIEGWQQIKGVVTAPDVKAFLTLKLKAGGTGKAWYDDLRFHPEHGKMKSYLYDAKDARLSAILDEGNFASLFFYNSDGSIRLVKKETEAGIKTISESIVHNHSIIVK